MAMKEGTYEVPPTPAAPRAPVMPIAPPLAPVAAAVRPVTIPTPAPAALSSNRPVISNDCGEVKSGSPGASRTVSSDGKLGPVQDVPGMRPFVLLPMKEDAALRKKIVDRLDDQL